ncbi:amino acid adenylation domain-containing protein [Kitasatospora sp. NPDC059160]|uniref:amino acid adenylation domain-containing protein n=1 Tax=Kitasatospora sp. NPDC059160 TaxID=3346748 RepID=UPI0036AB0691
MLLDDENSPLPRRDIASEVVDADVDADVDVDVSTVRREERTGSAPLSYAQERLWFLDRMDPGNTAYTVPVALHLRGELDRAALARALDRLVDRHEILRTRFTEGPDGAPVQVVDPRGELPLTPVDAAGWDDARLSEALHREAYRPFDLARGPLARASLLRRGPQEHVLLLTMHHIVTDGWSSWVLSQELEELYGAFRLGEGDPLPELPVQYADFAIWQRRRRQGEPAAEHLAYWRDRLAGLEPLDLPTDRPRPAVRGTRGASHSITLPEDLATALHALTRAPGTTTYIALLATHQILLAAYTGRRDIAVGTPFAGRNRSEIEDLVGFFVNTVVVRTDLSGNPTVREVLDRTRESTLGAHAHQDLPFERLVAELAPHRDLSRTPLFQTMLGVQSAATGTWQLPGLDVRTLPLDDTAAKFDLTINATESDTGLTVDFTYSTELFDPATIERLAVHFQNVLRVLTTDPDARVDDLDLLGPEERHRILHEWNDTAAPHPHDRTVHQLVQEQARVRPDAIALVHGDQEIGYRELDERANRLAHRLRESGVRTDSAVGVCAERGPELVIGLLAVLKAGAAYLPLDPTHPTERLTRILATARTAVVLHDAHLADRLGPYDGTLIALGDPATATRPATDPAVDVRPDNLAYVIHTSGSTGTPKGVQITHRSALNTCAGMAESLAVSAEDRVLLKTPFAFDVSAWEFVTTLISGATLVIAPPGAERDPALLARTVHETGTTVLNFVPSLLQRYLEVPDVQRLSASLRVVLCGGEVLPATVARKVRDSLGGAEFRNLYGPSEATINATSYDCRSGSWEEPVPIGRPLDNTRAYVLDRAGRPVPIGVTGELYIGGDGLARGYHHQPALTADRFVPDPYATTPGTRLYRTGDLARYRPDGTLDFLGRTDDQVKIRGHRIEPGEIDARLLEHPAVTAGTTVVREDTPGDKRLVAYLTSNSPTPLSTSELREHLRRHLPDYMLPAAFLTLDELPLTPNGKIDRRALPAPDHTRPDLDTAFTAPTTPTEQALARIWTDILGLTTVGIHDNFFDLGGHSLLATRVTSRLRTELGHELPVRALFETPTIAQLATTLGTSAAVDTTAVRRAERPAAVPLSYAQERLWFLDRMDPDGNAYTVPVALHLFGALDPAALEQALHQLAARHEILRTRFAEGADSAPAQVIEPTGSLPLVQVDAGDWDDVDLVAALHQEASRPFDLAHGPLARAHLFRLDPQQHVLLLSMHHIVTDGWSYRIVARELDELYAALRERRPSRLTEPALQYADYAIWERSWLQGELVEGQAAYWREQLAELEPLDLPTDRPRPAVRSSRGATHTLTLPDTLTTALHKLGQDHGVTTFMTLMAIYQILLRTYTGHHDIAVGTPVANRNRSETEDLIGFFVNTLVLRADLTGNPTLREVLNRTRDTALNAYAHQDLPFERLVSELAPQRDLSRTPLFQTMLTVHGSTTDISHCWQLAGLDVQTLPLDDTVAKFDLTVSATEAGPELTIDFTYSTDLFDASTIERLATHFQHLLTAVTTDPDARLDDLDLLSPDERRRILHEWNDTTAPYPHDRTVHQLVEQHARLRPEAIALVQGERLFSYRELNERANQLAHRLRESGVHPDTTVGICAERSPELVIGLLAVLKAGAAYLPLDPTHPTERLTHLLTSTGTAVVLHHPHQAVLAATLGGTLLALDDPTTAGHPTTDPDPVAHPGSLAFVLHTSGSTGTPKGVQITHQAVLRLTHNTRITDTTPDDVFLHLNSIAFDASSYEIWTPLTTGATLAIAAPGRTTTETATHDIHTHRPTVLLLTTALFHTLVEESSQALAGVRHVLTGGEALSATHVRTFLELHPGSAVVNVYGPTESTTMATCFTCRPGSWEGPVPIGRPIDNTRIHVLDPAGRPVPIGVTGELYLGGDGLARGYHHQPALTADRFVPDPFTPGARLYRTGDLARYRPDGTLDFLGRTDDQVKIRGHRIEPGEIDARLLEHPAVTASTTVVREDTPGDKRLVAYLTTNSTNPPSTSELREHLRRHLPDYMLPAAFLTLDRLPLTPNGKIDRRALPAPDHTRPDLDTAFTAPTTPNEQALARIWTDILGLTTVGIHDNFFDLGGHSLLATRVTSRLRTELGHELPVRALFETPTIAQLATTLGEPQAAGAPPVEAAERPAAIPLSYAQERLWFLDQMEPDSNAYTVPVALHLLGDLDRSALGTALRQLVARHEVLRTRFPLGADATPVQVIDRTGKLPLVGIEAGDWDDARLAQALADEAALPFDLEHGPLARARLFRLAPQEHVLLLAMHHIVTDGWSYRIVIRELEELYGALLADRPDRPDRPDGADRAKGLPELPVQYADFALWQRRWLQGEVLEGQAAYWREQLAGLEPLELPTDRPRPAVRSSRGATHTLTLPDGLATALHKLGQDHGVTTFMTLMATYQILLRTYTGHHDIAVGTPVANRNRSETEDLIGFFVNTLVLRADLTGNPTLREVLNRTRDTALNAYAHQDLPFERLVAELAPQRDLSRTPLFQTMLTVQDATLDSWQLPGLDVRTLPLGDDVAKFDLTVTATESDTGLTVDFTYSTDLFDAATIERLATHFQHLLTAVTTDPDARLDDLDLLSPDERRRILQDWNDTTAPYPHDRTVHQLVEQHAAERPDAIALVQGERRFSYRELNERANQLAHRLGESGVHPDTTVGICAERSPELVIGLLAVLKAGAAYLPLDPTHPTERLTHLLTSTRTAVVLHHPHQAGLSASFGGTLIPLDDPATADRPATDPGHPVSPQNLAYVIYTSGSTGTPKGVQITHQAVLRLTHNTRITDTTPDDVFLHLNSIAFDASSYEIWTPLTTGATLTVAAPGRTTTETATHDIHTHRPTVLLLTTALFNALMDNAPQAFATARHVLVGGEALSPTHVNAFQGLHPDKSLVNVYGPSESATITSTALLSTRQGSTVTIGRPIDNTRIHVLDPAGRPVPIGVTGELYIGGDGLARGYHHQPALTADRFLPDPYATSPGARLYRTGDLARYRPDGTVDFLGRTDDQVKIRGHRIELGEIDARLQQHPAVTAGTTVVREDTPGDKRLVAYLTTSSPTPPTTTELREHLRRHLPDYMLPAAFLTLDRLPLTPNGKIDRRALPAPDHTRPDLDTAFTAPATPAEQALARIWEEVLGLATVGIHDNFFELGGDSILGMQVIAKAKRFGLRLTPRMIFQYETVAEIAAHQHQAGAVDAEQGRVAGDVPLTPVQHWLFDQRPVRPDHFNQSVLLDVAGLAPELLRPALAAVVDHHDALRLRFPRDGAGPARHGLPADPEQLLSDVDLSAVPDAELTDRLQRSADALQRGLDIADGPLARGALFDLGGARGRLLLVVVHHLVVDGVSWRILLEDLGTAYAALAAGREVLLPAKTTSFRAWSRRLTEYALSPAATDELAYWTAAPPPVPLPRDRTARADDADDADDADGRTDDDGNTVAAEESVTLRLTEESTEALLRQVPRALGTQINDVLLTALTEAVAGWTGRDTVHVDLEGHGREDLFPEVDLSRTVGWFTSVFPVALHREPGAGPARQAGAVRDQLARVPRRGVGYGILRHLGTPGAREALGRPAPEISFNYLGQFDRELPGLGGYADPDLLRAGELDPSMRRGHLLRVTGSVLDGRLRIDIGYAPAVHHRETAQGLVDAMERTLTALVAAASEGAGPAAPTVHDFPLADLEASDLAAILKRFS